MRKTVRNELSLSHNVPVGVFAGHEFERKGLGVVLEGLRRVRERGVDMALLVAGSDDTAPFESEYADLADHVRYLGHRTDIERFFAAADVFLMPASFDISPLVGPEALACGLPLLMTDVGGVREYLHHGVNGFFIRRDPDDIAAKLEGLARNRADLDRMSAAARDSVKDRDWSAIAARFLALMDERFPLTGR